ncbi:hypothetical protein E2C01_087137 [Portunus trituberculatus]|uniref:Uncharacterized protein n=1 Tax=Portunus trituberculatus TaxID=210409 RepID=A0A5B7JBL2_PORTR|nr:hypothetical protein [Portunus trituberculatus]
MAAADERLYGATSPRLCVEAVASTVPLFRTEAGHTSHCGQSAVAHSLIPATVAEYCVCLCPLPLPTTRAHHA